MTNSVVEHIANSGHVRWAFKNAQYYWFVGGATDNPELQSQMRYRIMRDVETLGARSKRRMQQPVALITATQASPLLLQMLRKFPGWRTIIFGESGLMVPNADEVCCATADVILCYGEPSEYLTTLLDGQEDRGPELVRRRIELPERLRQPIKKEAAPYSRYWSDVDRLRHSRPNPARGLQIRDQIDMRPQFNV